jgi:hypothetical protein
MSFEEVGDKGLEEYGPSDRAVAYWSLSKGLLAE